MKLNEHGVGKCGCVMALERFKLLSVAWRAKVEEGTMPTNKEIGYLNCADQIDSLIAELEKEN